MDKQDEYFTYLMRRSRLGAFYRRHFLYPTVSKRLIGTALDIGCGIGDMLAFRPGTVGVDINALTVDYCRSRGLHAQVMCQDVLPFAAGAFDSVLLDNVLEHVPEPGPLLAEIRRVVRPGGIFVVGVPGIRGWDSDPDHKVRYDEQSLQQRIERYEFIHRETFHTPLWRSSWLDRHVRQYCIYGVFRR